MRIKRLDVLTSRGVAGRLAKDSTFAFTYGADVTPEQAVSRTMDVRTRSYDTGGALHPVFEMNLPEGYLRHRIAERLRKTAHVDDMLFLAIAGEHAIGRLRYKTEQWTSPAATGESLAEILAWDGQEDLFADLADKYLLTTTLSGVQPKVLVPEVSGPRRTLAVPSLIIKSGEGEYPGLAINEFICMHIARDAGLKVPEFWLSENQELFVMRRFDRPSVAPGADSEIQLGMEDLCVLMGKRAAAKYQSSYESVAKAIRLYCEDDFESLQHLFASVVLSVMVRNGDAHLKNFAVLYSDPTARATLAPVYDVVSTVCYIPKDSLALKLNKRRMFPNRRQLLDYAKNHCAVAQPAANRIIDHLLQSAASTLKVHAELVERVPRLRQTIEAGARSLT